MFGLRRALVGISIFLGHKSTRSRAAVDGDSSGLLSQNESPRYKVLPFRRRERVRPGVWECNCGCVTFRLYSDGIVKCAECNILVKEARCYWHFPESA